MARAFVSSSGVNLGARGRLPRCRWILDRGRLGMLWVRGWRWILARRLSRRWVFTRRLLGLWITRRRRIIRSGSVRRQFALGR
jgi:hypothetical protein